MRRGLRRLSRGADGPVGLGARSCPRARGSATRLRWGWRTRPGPGGCAELGRAPPDDQAPTGRVGVRPPALEEATAPLAGRPAGLPDWPGHRPDPDLASRRLWG